jgi:hypothetical protein
MRYLLAAYRVGMLALETLARRVHDDRPQAKYARNPPYGEDVKWLLRVAKKLGEFHHRICYLLSYFSYDIIGDTLMIQRCVMMDMRTVWNYKWSHWKLKCKEDCTIFWDKETKTVAFSRQANYTNWATATCRQYLVPTLVDRGVSRGQCIGSPMVVQVHWH